MDMKFGLASLILLAGCSYLPSVGPDYELPSDNLPDPAAEEPDLALTLPDAGLPTTNLTAVGEFVPAEGEEDVRHSLTADSESVASWWTRFDDPILTGLINEAVTNNLSYLMAYQRFEASLYELQGAYSGFMPQITGNASGTRAQWGKNTSSRYDAGSKLHRDVFNGGFDMTWEIDIFGGTRRAVEAAQAAMEAAQWTLADTHVTLTSQVGREYIDLRTTQKRIAVARTNLVLQTETYDIVKSRHDSGIGDELSVSQSKYVLDQTRASIPTLLAQEESLKNSIAILTGNIPGSLHDALAEVPDGSWFILPERLEEIPLNMIRSRPDVRVAERNLAQQVASVGVAEAEWYPKLYINGSLGLESVNIKKFARRESLLGSIGPSISWPIFQGGRVWADIKAAEAKMNEAYLNYEYTLDVAYGEVRDAYSAYTQEYHRCKALEGAVKAATDAVSISKNLYRTGLADFTDVIDAQRSLLDLEESLVESRGNTANYMITLFKALGGGRGAGEPIPSEEDESEEEESEDESEGETEEAVA